MPASSKIQKALAITVEICGGTAFSPAAAAVISNTLAEHEEEAVLRALKRCMGEVKGRLSLADILQRIEANDGRPSADVAWSIVEPHSEDRTIVATTEAMQAAHEVAHLEDRVAARMAFRDRYTELVASSRSRQAPVTWTVSLGHDPAGREAPLREGVSLGRIEPGKVSDLIGGPTHGSEPSGVSRLLAGHQDCKSGLFEVGVNPAATLAAIRKDLEIGIAKAKAESEARDRERLARLKAGPFTEDLRGEK